MADFSKQTPRIISNPDTRNLSLMLWANTNLQYYHENEENREIIWLSPRGKNPDNSIILTFLTISTPNMTMKMEKNRKKYGSPPAENFKMKSRQKKPSSYTHMKFLPYGRNFWNQIAQNFIPHLFHIQYFLLWASERGKLKHFGVKWQKFLAQKIWNNMT